MATNNPKFKVGDRVELFGTTGWNGWVPGMKNLVGENYTIKSVYIDDIYNNDIVDYYQFEEDPYLYWFPEDCIRLIKQEEKEMSVFKVGDVVRVVKRVDSEPGWINGWTQAMDEFIGTIQTIKSIEDHGVYFNSDEIYHYGFPVTSLELVESKSDKLLNFEVAQKSKNLIKYQYITPDEWEICDNPKLKGLCIAISTKIIGEYDGRNTVDWAITFKNPADIFSKAEARDSLNAKSKHQLLVDKKYTRDEIVAKILCAVFYDELFMVPHTYKQFVRKTLNHYLARTIYQN